MKIRKARYSKKEVDTLRELEYKRGIDEGFVEATKVLIAIPMLYLRTKEKYGAKRLGRFVDYFNMNIECMDEDELHLKDIINTLEDETGISFEGFVNERN